MDPNFHQSLLIILSVS